mgnify:CR=1 FL=1
MLPDLFIGFAVCPPENALVAAYQLLVTDKFVQVDATNRKYQHRSVEVLDFSCRQIIVGAATLQIVETLAENILEDSLAAKHKVELNKQRQRRLGHFFGLSEHILFHSKEQLFHA